MTLPHFLHLQASRAMGIFFFLVLLLASSIVLSFSLPGVFGRSFRKSTSAKLLPADDETESVHMKLNPHRDRAEFKNDRGSTENTENDSSDHLVELSEFVVNATNETLIAVVGNYRNDPEIKSKIEYYAMHKDGMNYTQTSHNNNISLIVRTYDQGDECTLKRLHALYTSEKLLSYSKEFPPSSYRMSLSKDDTLSQEEKDRAKFVDTMIRQHAKRIAIMNEYSVEEYDQVIEFAEKRAIHAFLHAIMVPTQGKRKQSIARKFAYCASFAAQASLEQQTAKIKELLIWFREEFPYYYSKCDYNNNDDGCANTEKDGNLYLGSVYPSAQERANDARAGVCELFLCHTCKRVTRFPRYHAMNKVLESRKGRCGEYSILMMRILQELGYRARYVADWADHVWCEIQLNGKWVHVDSCEASINEPHLYHSWGKNQTFIFAFQSIRKSELSLDHKKLQLSATAERCVVSKGAVRQNEAGEDGDNYCRKINDDNDDDDHPIIVEDVTFSYTPSSQWPAAMERRVLEHIDEHTIMHAMTNAARLITSPTPNAGSDFNRTMNSSTVHN